MASEVLRDCNKEEVCSQTTCLGQLCFMTVYALETNYFFDYVLMKRICCPYSHVLLVLVEGEHQAFLFSHQHSDFKSVVVFCQISVFSSVLKKFLNSQLLEVCMPDCLYAKLS